MCEIERNNCACAEIRFSLNEFVKLFIFEDGGGFDMRVESMGVGLKYCIPSEEGENSPAGPPDIGLAYIAFKS